MLSLLRNVKGHPWNRKQVYRICRALELNLRIEPRRRLKRGKPEELSVPFGATIGPPDRLPDA